MRRALAALKTSAGTILVDGKFVIPQVEGKQIALIKGDLRASPSPRRRSSPRFLAIVCWWSWERRIRTTGLKFIKATPPASIAKLSLHLGPPATIASLSRACASTLNSRAKHALECELRAEFCFNINTRCFITASPCSASNWIFIPRFRAQAYRRRGEVEPRRAVSRRRVRAEQWGGFGGRDRVWPRGWL